MAWYGLVEPSTGNLVSVGTEALFPNGDLNAFTGVYEVVTFGETAPNWATQLWNATTRALVARPPQVFADRLDDIEAYFQNDADYMTVWNALSQTRKTQLRTGLRRVLGFFLGGARYRDESEAAEL
jgi:hypothetical protein